MKSFDDLCYDLVLSMGCSRDVYGDRVGAMVFNSALAMCDGYDFYKPSKKAHDEELIPADATWQDTPDIDICSVVINGSGHFQYTRTRRVRRRRTLPGRWFAAGQVVECSWAFVDPRGTDRQTYRLYCFDNGKGRMRTWHPRGGEQEADPALRDRVTIHRGFAFADEMFWSVELGIDNNPSVRFWTDPVGAREVFRLRDMPPGKQRRSALRHWVCDHWRRKPVNEGLAEVRRHLRGATSFSWNGLTCKIRPSADDMRLLCA